MEVPGGKENKISVCLHELFGTMLLLIAINWGAPGGQIEAIAITIFIAIVIGGPVCGAHYNPAVTIATWMTNGDLKGDFMYGVYIILSQIMGGFIGCFIAMSGTQSLGKGEYKGGVAKLCPGMSDKSDICDPGDVGTQIFIREMVTTFAFVQLIMIIKRIGAANDGYLNAQAVSLSLYGVIQMQGKMTGACFNPAVAICQTFYQSMMFEELTFNTFLIYLTAPALGGVLSGLFTLLKMKYDKKEGDGELVVMDTAREQIELSKFGIDSESNVDINSIKKCCAGEGGKCVPIVSSNNKYQTMKMDK